MTGKHMNFVQELTVLALTGLPVITSPSFVLSTRDLKEWIKIEDHVTGRISSHELVSCPDPTHFVQWVGSGHETIVMRL